MNLWRGGNFKTETYTANIKIKKNVSVSTLKLFKNCKKAEGQNDYISN